jgi:hypothetical protein
LPYLQAEKNESEAIVCTRCGTSLEEFPMGGSDITRTTEVQTRVIERMGELLINEAFDPAGGIAMYLAGTSDPVFLSSEKEFVIGRKVVGDGTTKPFLILQHRAVIRWGYRNGTRQSDGQIMDMK